MRRAAWNGKNLTLINREGPRDQRGPQQGRKKQDHLPILRIVCRHNFQLRIKIQREIHQACKRSSAMSRRERLEGIVDFLVVARANGAIVHDPRQTVAMLLSIHG